MKRILILEPYFGGSHKYFLDGLQLHVEADYTLFSLPARKWKMRMQLSAPWFIGKIKELSEKDRRFDVVLCSTFVDVAMLRAMLLRVDGWNHSTDVLTYFHENQFAYPEQFGGKSNIFAFTAINFNTALASDRIAFNSSFNKNSFLKGCEKYLKGAADMKFPEIIDDLEQKSCILSPGIDFSEIDRTEKKKIADLPVIVWNHRWEHDKNPEQFFETLKRLEEQGADFRLILLGQSFNNSPPCFEKAQIQFKEKLIHCGFAESYEEYASLLRSGDLVVSTSLHEFFGISIIEAVRAGCIPVLPDRLSYPELFNEKFLYPTGGLGKRLKSLLMNGGRLSPSLARSMTEKFSWQSLKKRYDHWLFGT